MKTQSVTESIVEYLKVRIISGQLLPGQKLNENNLRSLMDVSTGPLREAFRILHNENLVWTIPRKGCFVTEVSIEDCRKLYTAREIIELSAMDLLEVQNIRDLQNAFLTPHSPSVQYKSSLDALPQEMGAFIELTDFHLKLVESTGNDWLGRLYRSITSTIARYQFLCYSPKFDSKGNEDHKLIVKLIKKGNYDRGKKILTNHIRFFFNQVEKEFNKNDLKNRGMSGSQGA